MSVPATIGLFAFVGTTLYTLQIETKGQGFLSFTGTTMNVEHWVAGALAGGVPTFLWLIRKGWLHFSVRLDVGQPPANAPVPLKKGKRKSADE